MIIIENVPNLEGFRKDHVTMETGVIAAGKFSFAIMAINYILK